MRAIRNRGSSRFRWVTSQKMVKVNPMSHMVRYLYPATVDDPVFDIDAMEAALSGAGRNLNVRVRRSSADWPQAGGGELGRGFIGR